MSLGEVLFPARRRRIAAYEEAASLIESVVDGRAESLAWSDFTSTRQGNAFLESARKRCARICAEHPATEAGRVCSAAGLALLRAPAREIRGRLATIQAQPLVRLTRSGFRLKIGLGCLLLGLLVLALVDWKYVFAKPRAPFDLTSALMNTLLHRHHYSNSDPKLTPISIGAVMIGLGVFICLEFFGDPPPRKDPWEEDGDSPAKTAELEGNAER